MYHKLIVNIIYIYVRRLCSADINRSKTKQTKVRYIDPDPTHAIDENTIKRNMKTIHTTIVQDHLSNRPINKLLNRPPPDIDKKRGNLTPLYPTQTFPTQDKQIPSPHDLPTQNRPCQPPSSKLPTLQRPKP